MGDESLGWSRKVFHFSRATLTEEHILQPLRLRRHPRKQEEDDENESDYLGDFDPMHV